MGVNRISTLSTKGAYVFFNPELVERLAACGITPRARRYASPSQGFVLGGRATSTQGRRTVTHVIEAHGHVTITEQRRLTEERSPASWDRNLDPRMALELAEECGRLRLDNQRLTAEVGQLRAEVDRLTTRPDNAVERRIPGLDDAAQRFALLELE